MNFYKRVIVLKTDANAIEIPIIATRGIPFSKRDMVRIFGMTTVSSASVSPVAMMSFLCIFNLATIHEDSAGSFDAFVIADSFVRDPRLGLGRGSYSSS